MINAWNKLKEQILKPVEVENEWNEYPPKALRLQSTVDEGKGMTDIQRKVHVWKETKGLNDGHRTN